MSESEVEFSVLETNEIFEKKEKDFVIQKINDIFGQPKISENKSGNTNIGGQTKWILEKKIHLESQRSKHISKRYHR